MFLGLQKPQPVPIRIISFSGCVWVVSPQIRLISGPYCQQSTGNHEISPLGCDFAAPLQPSNARFQIHDSRFTLNWAAHFAGSSKTPACACALLHTTARFNDQQRDHWSATDETYPRRAGLKYRKGTNTTERSTPGVTVSDDFWMISGHTMLPAID